MSISDYARVILEEGLSQSTEINLPNIYHEIAREVYDVPERPDSFIPKFVRDRYKHTAVLTTGGLDSTVAWLMAPEPKTAYYVNMGQEYAQKEMASLQKVNIPFHTINVYVQNLDAGWKHIHPGRNFYYLALVAERQMQPTNLLLGAVDGEMSELGGDKSWRFLRLANQIFAHANPPTRIITPLSTTTKADLVEWAIEHGHLEVVKNTISCFSATSGRCGQCQSCLRTWMAFSLHGVELEFDVHPMVGAREAVEKYERVLRDSLYNQDFSHYSERRCLQDLEAMSAYHTRFDS